MSGLIGAGDVASDANFQPAAFQGYLEKKSPKGFLGKHLWQRRFFVLEKDALSYYKDKQQWASGTPPIGVVRVDMIRDIQIPVDSSHYGQRFDVLVVGGHLFELMSPSEKSCTQWVRALREEVAQRGGVVSEALRHVKDEHVASGYWKKKDESELRAMHAHAEKAVPVPAGKGKAQSRQHSRSNSRSRNFEQDDEESRDRAAALAVMMQEEQNAKAAKAGSGSSGAAAAGPADVVVGGGSMVAASSGGYASMFKKKPSGTAPPSAGHTPPAAPEPEEEMTAEERAQQFLKRQYTLGANKASKGRVGEGAVVTSAAAAAATAMAASATPTATTGGGATPQRHGGGGMSRYGDSDSDEDSHSHSKQRGRGSSNTAAAAAGAAGGVVVVKIHGDDDDDDDELASPSAGGGFASAAGAAAASAGSPVAAAVGDDTPYISTVLWKESPNGLFKPWQKRLFALKDGAICYYKAQGLGVQKSNLAGTIPIHQITKVLIVSPEQGNKHGTDFNLLTTEGRIYKLRSESAEVTKQWVAFIQACDPRRLGCTFPGLVVRETPESAEQGAAIKPQGGVPVRGRLMASSALSARTVVSVMPVAAAGAAGASGAAGAGAGSGGLTAALPPTPDDAASQEIEEQKTFWNFLRNKHSLFSIFYVKKKAAFPRSARAAMFLLDLIMNLFFVYVFIIYAEKHDGKPEAVEQILSIIVILVAIEMVLGWLLRFLCFDRSLSVMEQHIRLAFCAVSLYALFISLTVWQWTLLPQNVAIMALVRFFLSALGVIVLEIVVWALLYSCATECCPCLTLDAGARSLEDIQAEKDEAAAVEREKQRKIDIQNKRAKMHKKIDKRIGERNLEDQV